MCDRIFSTADILIPHGVDMRKWSIVACDQYTSEPGYWKRVGREVGNSSSTLNMIFPEVFLDELGAEIRINKINEEMKRNLEDDIFELLKNAYIYTEREMSVGKFRHGLIGKIDLESYSFTKNSHSPIRPTEGTVESRLPPRIKIRENAPLELPHILLLLDDPDLTTIEPLENEKYNMRELYNFELMEGGGELRGYLCDAALCNKIDQSLDKIFKNKEMQLAVGDGNHSLATAKSCWEALKPRLSEEQRKTHPARWALVELVNIYDEALEFEPIHRVVFGANYVDLLETLMQTPCISGNNKIGEKVSVITRDGQKNIWVSEESDGLVIGAIQSFLDNYVSLKGGKIDYIHGKHVIEDLVLHDNAIGFLLPVMDKHDLFPLVLRDGALPRKTFSLGESNEKRFYLECRKIIL